MKINIAPIIFIAIGVVARLLPHLPNATPIAAMAIFGGMYLNKKYALVLPLVALLIGDAFIGFYGWSMLFGYLCFLFSGLVGLYVRNRKNAFTVFGGAVFSSLVFFIVTNLSVWALYTWYPHNLAGFIQCFTLAIPFFKGTLLGDVVYSGLFIGGYELLLRIYPKVASLSLPVYLIDNKKSQ